MKTTHPNLSKRPRAFTIAPLSQSKGLSIPTEPIKTQKGDMGVSMKFEIREKREAPELSTQGKGTHLHLHQP